jgi:aspartate/tyrosine/aromatic aminotransferase
MDEFGKLYKYKSVELAEQYLYDSQTLTHEYLPSAGESTFLELSTELYFGQTHYKAVQTIGGTGALSLANSFLNIVSDVKTLWLSNPTWENHYYIFSNFNVRQYDYLNNSHEFDFDLMLNSIKNISDFDIILLQGCAHNPTGYDLTLDQWKKTINLCREKNLYIIIDLAYAGFTTGNFVQDCTVLNILNEYKYQSLVCTSYSKNFGLYSDRVGLLFVSGNSDETTNASLAILKGIIRRTYSTPPSNGSKIITHILKNPCLKELWEQELLEINCRYQKIRTTLKIKLESLLQENFSDIEQQRGMFWFARSHLSDTQINCLIQNHIHIVKNGRISISSLNNENIDRFVDIFVKVKKTMV